ncbi:hypothetical protein AVEN_130223-1 [Araneus ventricosus]|uniref:Uncharacterized protein n=1 Tax=Araneus ventricosus TaxID=182803 RepID=A0A4Y2GFR4_ARAVE|nr:hypothetical protein AVEN_130223-1 [Araneus ventricosus]
MTPRVLPFVPQTSYFVLLITSVRFSPFRIEVFTYCSQCRLHTKKFKKFFLVLERLRKLRTEVETYEDSDFDNGDNGPGDVLEEIFSDHENVSEQDTESEEGGGHYFSTYQ